VGGVGLDGAMRETSGKLKDYWYAAGLVGDVTAKKPVARTILGTRLALWRAADGRPVAMLDRCLHRNAPLSCGDLFDGKIGCPYHGWTYGPDGKLLSVPSSGGKFKTPDLTLQTFPTTESDGLVWVWLGDGAPDKRPFAMPYWDSPGWHAYYMVTDFDNGVTELAENFMDVPHTVYVHKGWFRSASPQRKPVRTLVERTDHSVLVTYDQPKDEIGFTSRLLNPKNRPMVHTDNFYMPNVTRVDYDFGGESGFVITSTITPEAPYRSRVYTLISYHLALPVIGRLGRFFLPWYTRRVITQDVQIMAVHGANLQHHRAPRFHDTDADLHHQWIELLRGRAESGHAEPPPERREITFFI
jgi:phenylpropionate dioxygenase-like ring-hydroxylating dioxygenase large terminal subunit